MFKLLLIALVLALAALLGHGWVDGYKHAVGWVDGYGAGLAGVIVLPALLGRWYRDRRRRRLYRADEWVEGHVLVGLNDE